MEANTRPGDLGKVDLRAIRAEFRHSHYAGAPNHVYWRALGFDHRDAHLAVGVGIMGAYAYLAVRMA